MFCTIPGVMLVVFVATMVGLLTRAPAVEPAAGDDPAGGGDDDDDRAGDQSEASTEAVLAATPSH